MKNILENRVQMFAFVMLIIGIPLIFGKHYFNINDKYGLISPFIVLTTVIISYLKFGVNSNDSTKSKTSKIIAIAFLIFLFAFNLKSFLNGHLNDLGVTILCGIGLLIILIKQNFAK